MYVCIFGCAGSSLPREFFASCGVQASSCGGVSCCGTQALGLTGFRTCRAWGQQLWLLGSRAQAPQLWCTRLHCSLARAIFQDQGSNPCLLHQQVDSTTGPPGKPRKAFFFFGEVIAIHKFHFNLVQILLVAFVLCMYALLHCRRWCVYSCECVCTASGKIVCILVWFQFTSVEFSRSVVSDSL